MRKISLLISSLAMLATALVGCGGTSSSLSLSSSETVSSASSSSEVVSSSSSSSSSAVVLTPADLNTDLTDAYRFTADYAGKNFIANGIGEVYLKSNTDGDTSAFYTKPDHTESVKCRYLGINTPESTGKVQPWGNAASAFTKAKLLDATKIVLINDVATFGTLDSSGGRYLGFVWYIPSTGTEFRLLNLELVELAYTQNLFFDHSDICNYFDVFQLAGAHAEACHAKIFGETDPTFDYSGQIYAVSIRWLRANYGIEAALTDYDGNVVYENDGVTPQTVALTNSTEIRVRVIIVGVIGNNIVVRDVTDPDPITGEYSSVYCFTQYRDTPFHKIGDIVQFYCKATVYMENVQLTDPEMSTYSAKYPYQLLARVSNANYAEIVATNGWSSDAEPVVVNPVDVTASAYFAPKNGYYVTTQLTIRTGVNETPDDLHGDYWTKDASGNLTVYAYVVGTTVQLGIREDAGVFPYINYPAFEANHTYTIAGYISAYYENYQLQIFNGVTVTEVL